MAMPFAWSTGQTGVDIAAHNTRHQDGGADEISIAGLSGAPDSATAISRVFHVNAFVCPAPGTDWTPQVEGVLLPANKSSKKCWLPLNFLKVSDVITSYNIIGDVVKVAGDTVTLDCKLVRVNKADPITTTDLTNGAITQVTADGNFDATANVNDETVATDKQYVIEILGSTSNVSTTEQIIVIGAEITITRLL